MCLHDSQDCMLMSLAAKLYVVAMLLCKHDVCFPPLFLTEIMLISETHVGSRV